MTVRVSSYGIGGKATVTCAEGYILHGKPEVECLSNGEWSQAERSQCRPIQCPVQEPPENGFQKYGEEDVTGLKKFVSSKIIFGNSDF